MCLQPPQEQQETEPSVIKRSLRAVALLVLLVSLVPLTNLLVVLAQYQSFWSPRVASGQMTFSQAVYSEWVWYYTGHRYGPLLVLAADLPGLALLLTFILFRSYQMWSKRKRKPGSMLGAEPSLFIGDESSWPPPPRGPEHP